MGPGEGGIGLSWVLYCWNMISLGESVERKLGKYSRTDVDFLQRAKANGEYSGGNKALRQAVLILGINRAIVNLWLRL